MSETTAIKSYQYDYLYDLNKDNFYNRHAKADSAITTKLHYKELQTTKAAERGRNGLSKGRIQQLVMQ